DARFGGHNALDVRSILRAVEQIVVFGELRSGASTIPMQLARLLQPTPSTLRGKLRQMIEAEQISVRSERATILEAYVNRVPMGGNLYGIEAAARTYFGEPAADLDLAQASLLASVPNDPSRLAPDRHLDAARARQRYVLARMVALGNASAAEAARAGDETIAVRPHDTGITDAPHALFALYPHAEGSRVRTTIDRDLQRFVQAQTREVIAALGNLHVQDAAALVVDNHTGDVLAYVGSPDYLSDAELGRNDGVQALRQPGSSLKPFTYELALERRTLRSTSILPDVPSTFAVPGGKLYQPADYSGRFAGPVRVRYALADSLNVPAVRVLSALGTQTLLDRLHELGFAHLDKPADYYGLGLTLGAGEVSLWENTAAYVAMARDGSAIPLRLTAGSTVEPQRIGDAPTWQLVTGMLADPHARAASFGLHSVLDLPFDAAVKTGTSSDFRDTWTIGFTRDYTVGVWVGNFDGSAMHGVSGVTGAGPLWNRIMLHLHERNAPARFAPPSGYVSTRICATTGLAPLPGCPAIVAEWVLPRDLAEVRRNSPTHIDRSYDAWLASQPPSSAGYFRITVPENGAIFYRNRVVSALQSSEQQLALHATGPNRQTQWFVNGKRLPLDAGGNAFWPLAVGIARIEARNARGADAVTIRVFPAPVAKHPAITVGGVP
ncbi:MAG: penicillin-binding protein 1C, partial [Candidatus Baltobacteraceae bacterium]